MLDQILLATQLAFENVDANEVKSVAEKAYTINDFYQSEQANSMVNQESKNALININKI